MAATTSSATADSHVPGSSGASLAEATRKLRRLSMALQQQQQNGGFEQLRAAYVRALSSLPPGSVLSLTSSSM